MAQGLVTFGDLFQLENLVAADELPVSDEQSFDDVEEPSPSAIGCLIVGMDFTAKYPKRWRTFRARYRLPDLSPEELAEVLGVTERTVRNHLRPVNLATTANELFRDRIGRNGKQLAVEDLLWQGRPVTLDDLMLCLEWDCDGIYELSTPTARYFLLALDFAAREPKRWKTIRRDYFFPDLSQQELAVMLETSQKTVSQHLQPVKLAETDEFFNKDLMSEVL